MVTNNEWKYRIAYLGPEASFTYLATNSLFQNEWNIAYRTIPECIDAVTNDLVDYAVVPLENALEGSVPLTIDYLFHEANLYIIGEIKLKIQQHLMVNKAQKDNWEKLEGIYSHSHALAQCHKYLFIVLAMFRCIKLPPLRRRQKWSLRIQINVLQQSAMRLLLKSMDWKLWNTIFMTSILTILDLLYYQSTILVYQSKNQMVNRKRR